MKHRLFVLAVGSILVASAAYAHHSFAKDYDETKSVTLDGEVVSFDMRNPHSWVYFTAKDPSGVMRKYGAEWFNLRRLQQTGVSATTFKTGDHVVVTGAPNRMATEYSVHLKSIRKDDGWVWPSGAGGGFGGGRRYGRFR
jgi:exonuclease VII large subunit